MKMTVGVMGSAGGPLDQEAESLLVALGRAIAEHDCILITGGCPGLPYAAVQGAKTAGGMVVGISPGCPWQSMCRITTLQRMVSMC